MLLHLLPQHQLKFLLLTLSKSVILGEFICYDSWLVFFIEHYSLHTLVFPQIYIHKQQWRLLYIMIKLRKTYSQSVSMN